MAQETHGQGFTQKKQTRDASWVQEADERTAAWAGASGGSETEGGKCGEAVLLAGLKAALRAGGDVGGGIPPGRRRAGEKREGGLKGEVSWQVLGVCCPAGGRRRRDLAGRWVGAGRLTGWVLGLATRVPRGNVTGACAPKGFRIRLVFDSK